MMTSKNNKIKYEDIIPDLLVFLRGEATSEQEKLLHDWLEQNPEHATIYHHLCEIYYKIRYTSLWKQIDTAEAIRQVRCRTRKERILRKRVWYSGIAAAIAVIITSFLFLKQQEAGTEQETVAISIHAGERKAVLTLADGRQVFLKAGQTTVADLGFAQALCDSANGLTYHLTDSLYRLNEYNTLSVPRGGEYVITLSDGTRVWLNSETELKYPVIFGTGPREIYVTGEAFFQVAKDPERYFIVHTPHSNTIVYGTSFNVMAYQGEDKTEITLVQGIVTVKAGDQDCFIYPGEQIVINNSSQTMTQQKVDVSFYTSWRDGLFNFEGMTLEELIVKLSRWYDVDFFFVNSATCEKRFTGAIKRNNTLRFMLDFIEKTSDVQFIIKGKTISVFNK